VPETVEDDIGVVTNVGVDDEELPAGFALAQNYPNPFNPVTTIEYSVPATGQVTLEVLDMLGRQVALLVSAEQSPGSYTVKLDGQEMASGLYVYRLTAGSLATTRKMLLMK
ncbi:MAG: T9SS type A sorting domain-containing protein, partial [Rhodothermales bacterium]